MGVLRQGCRQPASGAGPANGDPADVPSHRPTLTLDPPQGSVAVFQRGREGVLGRAAVIDRNHAHPQFASNLAAPGIVLFWFAANIPAAVQPEQDRRRVGRRTLPIQAQADVTRPLRSEDAQILNAQPRGRLFPPV